MDYFQENSSIPDSDRGEFDGLWTFKTDINQTPFNAEPRSLSDFGL